MVERKAAARQLEGKNLALKARLEEVSQQQFVVEETEKLLGVGKAAVPGKLSPTSITETGPSINLELRPGNFQKWKELFFY